MDKCTFRILRFDPKEGNAPYYQDFVVEITRQGFTILDGLFYILNNLDGSLAFRSSCRAGVCGSCAMHIDGKYRLACETQITFCKGDPIVIRPLAHLPIIKDLMVDMNPFWEKYKSIRPFLIPGDANPEIERLQTIDERAKLDGVIDCVLCAACHASCPITGMDEKYLGPAVLTKANRFVLDSRDKNTRQRLELVGDEHGIWRCHSVYNCQEVCPKKINPTGHIMDLRRAAMKLLFKAR